MASVCRSSLFLRLSAIAVGWLLALPAGGVGPVLAASGQGPGSRRDAQMTWWRQSRVGMLVHWGLFSVPAGQWKGKVLPGPAERIMREARIGRDEYIALAQQFGPRHFSAVRWAQIARQAGIRYVGITAKHHEGFCLWKSKASVFSLAHSAWGRDVVAELGAACRRNGLGFGVQVSLADWCSPLPADRRIQRRAQLAKEVAELTTQYRDVLLVWLDVADDPRARRDTADALAKVIRTHKPRAILGGPEELLGRASDVRSPPEDVPNSPSADWELRLPVAGSAGYKAPALDVKPTRELVRTLAETVSRGGNLLLEVPATADGKIPVTVVARLLGLGRWLSANGRSIYGANATPLGRPGWGPCTHRTGEIYLHVFDWPKDGQLEVPAPIGRVTGASFLDDPKKSPLEITRTKGMVRIHVGKKPAEGPHRVVAMAVDGDVQISKAALAMLRKPILLHAKVAKIHGEGDMIYENRDDRDNLGYWHNQGQWASWDFTVQTAGEYAVEICFACDPKTAGNSYVLTVGGKQFRQTVPSTGDWGNFVTKGLGRVRLDKPGKYTVSVKPVQIRRKGSLMNLQSVTLRPVR